MEVFSFERILYLLMLFKCVLLYLLLLFFFSFQVDTWRNFVFFIQEAISLPWRSLPKKIAKLFFALRGMLCDSNYAISILDQLLGRLWSWMFLVVCYDLVVSYYYSLSNLWNIVASALSGLEAVSELCLWSLILFQATQNIKDKF